MEAKWVVKNSSKSHILFFCGWGFDERCLKHISSQSHDVVAIYDYRSLDFDASVTNGYDEVVLVAWSFGVWAAGWLMEQGLIKANSAYAINGTLNPVSDSEGIPPAIFEGTVGNLTEATMKKFMMRICGGARGYAELSELMPQRCFEEQKEELILLGEYFQKRPFSNQDIWSLALISADDLIFPFQNMKNHWGDKATTIAGAHLCFGKVESWEEIISE